MRRDFTCLLYSNSLPRSISLEQLIAIIVLSVYCPVNTLLGHSVYILPPLLTEMTDSLRGRGTSTSWIDFVKIFI